MQKKSGFSPDFETDRISVFLGAQLQSSGAKGYVVGLSGGVDSAVVAALCQQSIGSENVLCLRLFEDFHRGSQDYLDAGAIIKMLKVKSRDIQITPIITACEEILSSNGLPPVRLTLANLKARVRMTILYAFANQENYLVAGTGDKSEDLIGYFTKYGDGGVDVLPIAHLYKGQVRQLARRLGLPENVVTKPSSPNLWKGHKATDEIPADYEVLDRVLPLLFDQNLEPKEVSDLTGVSIFIINDVVQRNRASSHKRVYPALVANS